MSKLRFAIIAGVSLALAAPAGASDFSDPEWPCIQRKVENLSLGLMWPSPVPDGALRAEIAPEAKDLVSTVVLRRIPLEEIDGLVTDFTKTAPDLGNDDLGQVFREAFNRINNERSRLISGISRYSRNQIELAATVEAKREEMEKLMEAENPDFDRVDELELQLAWDERIYQDRAHSLTYVCETPVLLEKRAYAIAQALSHHLLK